MAPPQSALDFLDFVNASPTPYHAVASSAALFDAAGFTRIQERDDWASAVKPGGKYYLTRNASSIVAFAVGGAWKPGNPIGMVGAHTDSPCLRVKPVSKRTANGYLQVGVETYGGGIWHSWFDRDLSVAGRVLVREAADGGEPKFVQKLVKIDKPILRIPTLAIHLHRQSNFDPNKEDELLPIAGLVEAELNKTAEPETAPGAGSEEAEFQPLRAISDRHHPAFLSLIAENLGVEVSQITDFELVLYDTQKSCLGGLRDELIFSPRLDNLNSTFCAVKGLIASIDSHPLDADPTIRLVACFDHEEIGSLSAQGADSNLLPAVLRRLSVIPGSSGSSSSIDAASTAFEQTLSTSFFLSADMAHAVHPNYAGKYERNHTPAINGGPVIKINANQRYATNSPGIVLLQEVARKARVPLQLFVVKNDSPCGSTIGPMLSAKLGVRTLDMGNPQLSMHSIRETGGTKDVEHAIRLFEAFLGRFNADPSPWDKELLNRPGYSPEGIVTGHRADVHPVPFTTFIELRAPISHSYSFHLSWFIHPFRFAQEVLEGRAVRRQGQQPTEPNAFDESPCCWPWRTGILQDVNLSYQSLATRLINEGPSGQWDGYPTPVLLYPWGHLPPYIQTIYKRPHKLKVYHGHYVHRPSAEATDSCILCCHDGELHRLQRFEFRKPSDSLEVETSALEREGLHNRLDEFITLWTSGQHQRQTAFTGPSLPRHKQLIAPVDAANINRVGAREVPRWSFVSQR
ncbi:hypothetical protein VTJ04DRAFT_326 [Mycothermus thermophilus]|uniref:uncharacterized protein n=1 Tax=Humicola insolens TaxID=85995 RepID=UPI0037447267